MHVIRTWKKQTSDIEKYNGTIIQLRAQAVFTLPKFSDINTPDVKTS